jgi:hypothetical protein
LPPSPIQPVSDTLEQIQSLLASLFAAYEGQFIRCTGDQRCSVLNKIGTYITSLPVISSPGIDIAEAALRLGLGLSRIYTVFLICSRCEQISALEMPLLAHIPWNIPPLSYRVSGSSNSTHLPSSITRVRSYLQCVVSKNLECREELHLPNDRFDTMCDA